MSRPGSGNPLSGHLRLSYLALRYRWCALSEAALPGLCTSALANDILAKTSRAGAYIVFPYHLTISSNLILGLISLNWSLFSVSIIPTRPSSFKYVL